MLKKYLILVISFAGPFSLANNQAEVLQRLNNLGVSTGSCPQAEKVDLDSLRVKSLTNVLDLEMQSRLRKADESIDVKTKALSRVALHELCNSHKYGGGSPKAKTAQSLQIYKNAVLAYKFQTDSFEIPVVGASSVAVEIEKGGVTGLPTGWVIAKYSVPSESVGLTKTTMPNIEISVRKNIFDVVALSCYEAVPLQSRTSLFNGIVTKSGHHEAFTVTERAIAEEKGFSFMVENCRASGAKK